MAIIRILQFALGALFIVSIAILLVNKLWFKKEDDREVIFIEAKNTDEINGESVQASISEGNEKEGNNVT